MATSGMDLKLERTRAHLTAVQVAARIGVSRQTLWATERAAYVDSDKAAAYRAAVEALRDATEPSGAAA
jgi:DNA-binding XRE family transcriptional regulator